jgi:hypothetical protein
LRHGPNQIGAPADNDRIGDEQRQDGELQPRQRPCRCRRARRATIAAMPSTSSAPAVSFCAAKACSAASPSAAIFSGSASIPSASNCSSGSERTTSAGIIGRAAAKGSSAWGANAEGSASEYGGSDGASNSVCSHANAPSASPALSPATCPAACPTMGSAMQGPARPLRSPAAPGPARRRRQGASRRREVPHARRLGSAGGAPAAGPVAGLQYRRRRMWRSSGRRSAWANRKRFWPSKAAHLLTNWKPNRPCSYPPVPGVKLVPSANLWPAVRIRPRGGLAEECA